MDMSYILCINIDKNVFLSIDEYFNSKHNVKFFFSGSEAFTYCEKLSKKEIDIPVIICNDSLPDLEPNEFIDKVESNYDYISTILLINNMTKDLIIRYINSSRNIKFFEKNSNFDELYLLIDKSLKYYNDKKNYNINNTVKELKSLIYFLQDKIKSIEKKQLDSKDSNFIQIEKNIKDLEKQFMTIETLIDSITYIIKNNKEANSYMQEGYDKEYIFKSDNLDLFKYIDELSSKIDKMGKNICKKTQNIIAWDDDEIVICKPEEVLFFATKGRDIELVTKRREKYKVKKRIQELEEILTEYNFFRCHKSYLVNINYVNRLIPWFESKSLKPIIDGHDFNIPISRNYIKEMKRILNCN